MSKAKAVRIDHLADVPLDLPGVILRIERRHWADGSSCLHLAKWGHQPGRGTPAPWHPQQYIQVPWEMAEPILVALLDTVRNAQGIRLPTIDDITGIAPDISDGLTTEEHVQMLRDDD